MFKKNYYCLVAGLPDLFFFENKLVESSSAFCEYIKNDITPADNNLVKLLLLPVDNKNLIDFLFNKNSEFNISGNFSKNFIEEQIIHPTALPVYLADFLKWIKISEQKELNIQVENKMQNLFYNYALRCSNSFLRNWFLFELNLKNIITAINCSHFEYQMEEQLIHTDENTETNSLLLSNRFKPEYFEDDVLFAHEIFRIAESGSIPFEKEKAIDRIRWDYLDEMTFFHFFTIEKILSFILKMQITERWMKLDKETGKALLEKIINELKTSYKFSAEFDIVK